MSKEVITKQDIGELTQKEIELIFYLRNRWKWDEVVILMRNGQPYRVKRTTEYLELGG